MLPGLGEHADCGGSILGKGLGQQLPAAPTPILSGVKTAQGTSYGLQGGLTWPLQSWVPGRCKQGSHAAAGRPVCTVHMWKL